MDLSTTYLSLRLPHPVIAGASPLCDDLGIVRRLEDAGAAAIVMHSLFEEQIRHDRDALDHFLLHRFHLQHPADHVQRHVLGKDRELAVVLRELLRERSHHRTTTSTGSPATDAT